MQTTIFKYIIIGKVYIFTLPSAFYDDKTICAIKTEISVKTSYHFKINNLLVQYHKKCAYDEMLVGVNH